jgi:TRAP-type uncharacterized transport system fused permease subunit
MAAHFFILYMSISAFITPPVAMASYVCGQMVGKDGMTISFKAMRLGIVCYLVPFVSIYSPSLLLIGTPAEIAASAVTAVIGVILIAAGLEGFLVGAMDWFQRIAATGAGLLLFIPGGRSDLAGILIGLVPIVLQVRVYLKNKSQAVGG